MFQRILVPLDGSEHAERAIPIAARIARVTGGKIIFIHVVFSSATMGNYSFESVANQQTVGYETRLAQARDYLTYTITTAYARELADIPTEQDVEMGAAAPTIFATARLEQVDLIVMCSRGETGLKHWMFGSVAHEAVRHAPMPILVVHEHGQDLPELVVDQPLSVLVPLDGTALAEAALEPAIQFISALAAPRPAAIHLLRVVDVPSSTGKYRGFIDADALMRREMQQDATVYLQQLKERVQNIGNTERRPLIITASVVINPSVTDAIIEETEQQEEQQGRYAMIAMATHGRAGLQHLLMGSITEQVMDHTKLPLLILHSHAQEAPQEDTEKKPTHVAKHFLGKSRTPMPDLNKV